tara:strand:+ start:1093 stop:1257 length:165 start_codon:yes stop_codon:yes gene_type:complete
MVKNIGTSLFPVSEHIFETTRQILEQLSDTAFKIDTLMTSKEQFLRLCQHFLGY